MSSRHYEMPDKYNPTRPRTHHLAYNSRGFKLLNQSRIDQGLSVIKPKEFAQRVSFVKKSDRPPTPISGDAEINHRLEKLDRKLKKKKKKKSKKLEAKLSAPEYQPIVKNSIQKSKKSIVEQQNPPAVLHSCLKPLSPTKFYGKSAEYFATSKSSEEITNIIAESPKVVSEYCAVNDSGTESSSKLENSGLKLAKATVSGTEIYNSTVSISKTLGYVSGAKTLQFFFHQILKAIKRQLVFCRHSKTFCCETPIPFLLFGDLFPDNLKNCLPKALVTGDSPAVIFTQLGQHKFSVEISDRLSLKHFLMSVGVEMELLMDVLEEKISTTGRAFLTVDKSEETKMFIMLFDLKRELLSVSGYIQKCNPLGIEQK